MSGKGPKIELSWSTKPALVVTALTSGAELVLSPLERQPYRDFDVIPRKYAASPRMEPQAQF
jgi:hypothetical protein